MAEIKINSKILKFVDYKNEDFEIEFPKFKLDKDKLEKDVKRAQYANGTKESVAEIQKGDLVLLSCSSNNKRFQKNDIYVIVGKNLYSTELEEKLIGLSLGNHKITVDIDDVEIEIKEITRTTIPALTDENVKAWNVDANSVEELKRMFFKRQVDNFRDDDEDADMFNSMFAMHILGSMEFDFDDAEYNAVKKTTYAQVQNAGNDLDFDMQSFAEMMIAQTLKAGALGYKLCLENGATTNTDEYEIALSKRAIALGLSVDEAREIFGEIDYAFEYYAEYYFVALDKHIGDVMKEHYYRENNKPDIYDVAIIGAGPAGLSAALTLNLHNKTIAWFGSNELSDKVEKSEKIANYVGFSPISGKELNEQFRKQIKDNHLELTDKMVTQISSFKNEFMVLADNDIVKAKTVLLAIGSVPPKGIKNEQELLGHGVSYCATCDGFLYKGKSIAVFCGSPRYEHEVEYLAEIADKVYLYSTFESSIDLPNVEVLQKPMKSVVGDKKVSGIELTDGTTIDVDGAFFLRSAVAPATILKGLEMDGAHIVVNRDCETNIAGCFAAGDCTGRPYQIAKAVGEGNIAAHKIVEYLSEEK